MQMVTPRKRNRPENYNLQETDNIALDDENSVYYVHKIHHVKPLNVEMNVNNQNNNFEVDTVLGITLILRETLKLQINKY